MGGRTKIATTIAALMSVARIIGAASVYELSYRIDIPTPSPAQRGTAACREIALRPRQLSVRPFLYNSAV
jgi:hypothetical protein